MEEEGASVEVSTGVLKEGSSVELDGASVEDDYSVEVGDSVDDEEDVETSEYQTFIVKEREVVLKDPD